MVGKKELTSLSFFSGCLGLDLGLEKAGIHQLLACDNNKWTQATIKANRPDIPLIDDIANHDAASIRELAGLKKNQRPTLIVGGPPCQAFSTAGNRQSFLDPRGNVFLKYIQLIEELQPEYAVIENVRGLLYAALKPSNSKDKEKPSSVEELPGSALFYVLQWLEKIGYGVSFNLYNAAYFGVPQIRERVVLIAARDGSKLPYLTPTHFNDKNSPWNTFAGAVDGLVESNMTGASFPETRLKYYKLLKAGQYWKDLPEKLQKEALGKSYYLSGGKTGFLRRLAWTKPSPTLVTSPVMPATDLAHPERDRPLSVQEYKRIQEFPDGWIIEGNITEQYKQIGNAVPVGLGEAIGKTIIKHINKNEIRTNTGLFSFSRYKNTDDVSWKKNFQKKLSIFGDQQLKLFTSE